MKIATGLISLALLMTLIARAFGQPSPESTAAAASTRFVAFDIRIDPHGRPLAAYQFELSDPTGAATIVGVEGGEHAAYASPPYYDPAALAGGRIIIAAFNTGDALPSAATRVARIHMQITKIQTPQFQIKLQAAGTSDGSSIDADASISESIH